MMQQINPGLMKVLAAQSQINPVTPEGAPSVAANVLSKASQAGIAANLRAALPSVEQNAQDDQARQMLEAANRASQPAGIAGLNIPMGQYAEGGVVGYNGTEGSFADAATAANRAFVEDTRIDDPKTFKDFLINTLLRPLSRTTDQVEMLRSLANSAAENRKASAKLVSDLAATVPEETPQPMVPATLGAQAPTGGGLTTEAARGQAPREGRRESAPSAATRTSRTAGVAGLPAGRTVLPGEELYAQARREFLNQMPPDQRSLQERRAQEDEYLRSLGLPTSIRPAEEARLKQMEEFDAQTRAQIAKQNKEAMQGAWMSGILKPAQNLARMFSGAAEGMLGEEGKQREQAVRDAALQRQQMMAANAVRTKLDEADILRARGDIDGYNKAMEEARKFENALSVGLASLSSAQAKDVVNFEQAKALERIKQAGAERIARMRVEGTAGKPIYDTINDNVEKQMTAWSKVTTNKYASPAEVAAQRAKFVAEQITLAKQMGHTITPEMEALIKGTSAAPGTRENPIKLD